MWAIDYTLMRGGTSKCAMFRDHELPPRGEERDDLLLRLFGSPDPRQIDGIGGATSSTSKACIVAPSGRQDSDVEYTFGQVSMTQALVDWSGTCGNCTSAVGPFAIREGWVQVQEGITTVRIFNTNTQKRIIAEVPVRNGEPLETGDFEIAGVPGTGAPQRLWFVDPSGSKTGALFPTGQRNETIDVGSGSYHATLIDAGNPVVLVKAPELGLRGTETPLDLDGSPDVMHALEEIRAWSAVRMGLATTLAEASASSPAIPKIAVVAPSEPYVDTYGRHVDSTRINLVARMLSMGRCHGAYPLTGAIATGIAAVFDGTVAHTVANLTPERAEYSVKIGHPSGVIQVDIILADSGPRSAVDRVGVYRTARRLALGQVYPRQGPN